MKYSQITTSMAKDIAFKLGAVLNDEEAEIFADGYNVALLKVNKDVSTVLPNSASLSTNLPVIPDGYALVPVKPTREMLKAVHPLTEATCRNCGHNVVADCEDNVLLSWTYMIAAAPKPEDAND